MRFKCSKKKSFALLAFIAACVAFGNRLRGKKDYE